MFLCTLSPAQIIVFPSNVLFFKSLEHALFEIIWTPANCKKEGYSFFWKSQKFQNRCLLDIIGKFRFLSYFSYSPTRDKTFRRRLWIHCIFIFDHWYSFSLLDFFHQFYETNVIKSGLIILCRWPVSFMNVNSFDWNFLRKFRFNFEVWSASQNTVVLKCVIS